MIHFTLLLKRRRRLFFSLILASSSTLATAQVNISGKPGLMYIPTAKILDEGTFNFGVGYNPLHYAIRFNPAIKTGRTQNSENIYFIHLALLPRLEINLNLLRPNGTINFKDQGIGDRQLDIKYGILTEKKYRPSLVIIFSAPFGVDNSLETYALAVTKNISFSTDFSAEVTAGMGSPYYIYRDKSNDYSRNIFANLTLRDKRENSYYYLAGPFGGVNLSYKKRAGLMAEWDSQHLNVGAYASLFNHWTIQAGLLNGDQFTFGTSYSFSLLRLPKRITAQRNAN